MDYSSSSIFVTSFTTREFKDYIFSHSYKYAKLFGLLLFSHSYDYAKLFGLLLFSHSYDYA